MRKILSCDSSGVKNMWCVRVCMCVCAYMSFHWSAAFSKVTLRKLDAECATERVRERHEKEKESVMKERALTRCLARCHFFFQQVVWKLIC